MESRDNLSVADMYFVLKGGYFYFPNPDIFKALDGGWRLGGGTERSRRYK